MSTIRDKILDGIVEKGNVDAAYQRAAEESADEIVRAVKHGERADLVLRDLGFSKPSNLIYGHDLPLSLNQRILHMIVGGGEVHDVPSAECVGEKLKDKPNPTREDVERAFEECRGSSR